MLPPAAVKLYRECPRKKMSSFQIHSALCEYVPKSIVSSTDKSDLCSEKTDSWKAESLLRLLFKKLPDEMKRYKSADALAQNLETYLNFPGAHRLYPADICAPFTQTIPEPFQSIRRQQFISRENVFVHIQNMFLDKLHLLMHDDVTLACLIAFLKGYSEKLGDNREFVCITDAGFLQLERELVDAIGKVDELLKELSDSRPVHEDVLKVIRECHSNWDDEKEARLLSILEQQSGSENCDDLERQTRNFMLLSSVLKPILDRSDLVLPFPETKSSTNPIIIRLFEDGERRFAMVKELEQIGFDVEEESGILKTMDVKEVLRMVTSLPSETRDLVQVIKMPIVRAKHCALPIQQFGEGYCKLASDLFLEHLQDLIFGLNIFQKMKESEWSLVEKYFEKFDMDRTDIYFIPMDQNPFEDEEWIKECFGDILDRPVEPILSVECCFAGFAVECLERELVNFPTLQDHAQAAYDRVRGNKDPEILDSGDMFDAIEHCVRKNLAERIPKIKLFLHNQTCIRVLPTDCCFRNPRPRFSKTGLKMIKYADVSTEVSPNGTLQLILEPKQYVIYSRSACAFAMKRITCKGNEKAKCNEMCEKHTQQQTVFLLDSDDFSWYKESLSDLKGDSTKVVANLQAFVNRRPNKKLYLRSIALSHITREKTPMFVYEEVMDMIPILLERQGDSLDILITKPWKMTEWIPQVHLINLAEFIKILEHYDINKELFTVVPDIQYVLNLPVAWKNIQFSSSFPFFYKDNYDLMTMSEALFRIFKEVVCEIAWTKLKPKSLVNQCREEVLGVMKMCSYQFGHLIPLSWVQNQIDALKQRPWYLKCRKELLLTPYILLYNGYSADTISLSYFLSLCKDHGIPYHAPPHISSECLSNSMLPVWKARHMIMIRLIDFLTDNPALEYLRYWIRMGIYHRVPIKKWEREDDFWKVMVAKNSEEHGQTASLMQREVGCRFFGAVHHPWIPKTTWKDHLEIRRSPNWEIMDEHMQEERYAAYDKWIDGTQNVRDETMDMLKDILDFSEVNRIVSKMIEAVGQEEVVQETVSSQIVAEPLSNSDADVTESSGSPTPPNKNKKKKIRKAIKKASAASSEDSTTTSPPTPQASTPEPMFAPEVPKVDCVKCKRITKRCEDTKAKLKTMTSECEKLKKKSKKELDDSLARNEELERKNALLTEAQRASEARIAELEAAVQRQQVELQNAAELNEQKDVHIRTLKSHLTKETILGLKETHRLTIEMRRILISYQNARDALRDGRIERANLQIVKLLNLNVPPKVSSEAQYHLNLFHSQCTDCEREVVATIERIQADVFITSSEVPPLPVIPVLSEFVSRTVREAHEMNNRLLDAECLVCKTDDEGEWVECPECRQKTHMKCTRKWWNTKGVKECPHCQQIM